MLMDLFFSDASFFPSILKDLIYHRNRIKSNKTRLKRGYMLQVKPVAHLNQEDIIGRGAEEALYVISDIEPSDIGIAV